MYFKLDGCWREFLSEELEKPYFLEIESFLRSQIAEGKTIYPPFENVFNAFALCPFEKTKVVILGQDPYHGENQAMGLSFSVPKEQKIPPSLKNIFKEMHSDLGIRIPKTGDLTSWAKQGVLLLNSTLTVEKGLPNTHSKIGWATFTDKVMQKISEKKTGIVFLLWGNFARAKKSLIDSKKHLVLESAHPSPFSVTNFFGNNHFSRTNSFLSEKINWECSSSHK